MEYVETLADTLHTYFFLYLDSVFQARKMLTSNSQVLEIAAKANSYVDINNAKLQLIEYEETLKQHSRIIIIVALYVFFRIISYISYLICATWDKISMFNF